MEMYETNQELEDILLSRGYINVTDEVDTAKGKRRFVASKKSKRIIVFDYANLCVIHGILYIIDGRVRVSHEQLKMILFYVEKDWDIVNYVLKFTPSHGRDRLSDLENGFALMKKELNRGWITDSQAKKIERILNEYNTIKF